MARGPSAAAREGGGGGGQKSYTGKIPSLSKETQRTQNLHYNAVVMIDWKLVSQPNERDDCTSIYV